MESHLTPETELLCVTVGTMVAQALSVQDTHQLFDASFLDGLEMISQATLHHCKTLPHISSSLLWPWKKTGKTLTLLYSEKKAIWEVCAHFLSFLQIYISQGSHFMKTRVDYQYIRSLPEKETHLFLSGLNQIWGYF